MANSPASSSTTTTRMRVYNRRPKMTSAQARDWASLPPSLLEKVFRSLEVSDLQSAKETCRKWKEQVLASNNNQVPAELGPAAAPAVEDAADQTWMNTIDSILQHLQEFQEDPGNETDVEVMMQFLVQEGIIEEA